MNAFASLGILALFGFGALLVLSLATGSLKIAKEYERGGRLPFRPLDRAQGPGLFPVIPLGIERVTKVDLRVTTHVVPAQEVRDHRDAAFRARPCYMQTLLDRATNENSAIVFPMPRELIDPLLAQAVPLKEPLPVCGACPANGGADLVPDNPPNGR